MMSPADRFAMSYAYCANPLDRAARSRQDPDWLARRLSDRRTRIVLLAGESPYMRIGENACPQPYWSIDTVNCPLDAVCAPVFLGLDEAGTATFARSEEHTSELQSRE